MFETIFGYFEKILIAVSPIICAWMAWRSSTTQKQTAEYIELQKKYNQEHEKIKTQEAEKQKELLERMHDDIDSLKKQVDDLSAKVDNTNIENRLDKLFSVTSMNYEYSQSLSQVICAIGEVIEHSDLGDISNIRKELARHQTKEKEVSTQLLKLVE